MGRTAGAIINSQSGVSPEFVLIVILRADPEKPRQTTLEQLERQAESEPTNSSLQRRVFLYRALKGGD